MHKQTAEQMHGVLRTLVSNFFVDPCNSEWIDSWRVRQLVTHCIDASVEKANSIHDVLQNSVLRTIWRELTGDIKSKEFVRYLYKDLLQNQFMLESIASRVVVDSDLFEDNGERATELASSYRERGTHVRQRRLSLELLTDLKAGPGQSFEQRPRMNSFTLEDSSDTSVNRVKTRLGNLTRLIWDEFYLCDPVNAKVENKECPCGLCFGDSGPIGLISKCKMIPRHIAFFCRQIFSSCEAQYSEQEARLAVSHFLFEEWLLRTLCEDADKLGLSPNANFDESIRKNLVLVRLAINSLFLNQTDFEQSQNALPAPIASVCENRRTQAERFLSDLLQ